MKTSMSPGSSLYLSPRQTQSLAKLKQCDNGTKTTRHQHQHRGTGPASRKSKQKMYSTTAVTDTAITEQKDTASLNKQGAKPSCLPNEHEPQRRRHDQTWRQKHRTHSDVGHRGKPPSRGERCISYSQLLTTTKKCMMTRRNPHGNTSGRNSWRLANPRAASATACHYMQQICRSPPSRAWCASS